MLAANSGWSSGFAEGDIHRPREGVRLQHGVTVEPRIATEDLVSTFTGQRDLVVLRNLPTEIQQRRIDICHRWQTPAVDGRFEQIGKLRVGTRQVDVIRVQIVLHDINIRAVFTRLKAVCLKINGIVGIIEGVCCKRCILRRGNGYRRRIHTRSRHRRKAGGDRNVGHHLHTDTVFKRYEVFSTVSS